MQDELMGHHGQAEHGGKGKEGREAEHLAENMRLPRLVVADFHKHGLGYLRHRARNKGAGHGVPLEGLGEVAHGLGGKQTAENNSQHVLATTPETKRELTRKSVVSLTAMRLKSQAVGAVPRAETGRVRNTTRAKAVNSGWR